MSLTIYSEGCSQLTVHAAHYLQCRLLTINSACRLQFYTAGCSQSTVHACRSQFIMHNTHNLQCMQLTILLEKLTFYETFMMDWNLVSG